jgi:hypothetical protein
MLSSPVERLLPAPRRHRNHRRDRRRYDLTGHPGRVCRRAIRYVGVSLEKGGLATDAGTFVAIALKDP